MGGRDLFPQIFADFWVRIVGDAADREDMRRFRQEFKRCFMYNLFSFLKHGPSVLSFDLTIDKLTYQDGDTIFYYISPFELGTHWDERSFLPPTRALSKSMSTIVLT